MTLMRLVSGPVNIAVSVIGALRIKATGLFVPEKEPFPAPIQPAKLLLNAAVALMSRFVPASYQPLDGLSPPEFVTLAARLVAVTVRLVEFIVRKYCVLKLAVKTESLVG